MSNHLIIGLGGTGGNVIRSFRKTVYQTFSEDRAPNVNLRYLYVDSSDEFMKPQDPSWKVLGHNVQLSQRSQLHIQGMNLKSVIDNVNQYPGLKPWLGDRDDWRDILNAADAARVVGGQKRRLGRFLFATNAATFRARVMEFVAEMQQSRNEGIQAVTDTTFHVCCGLAGGTGSGAVIDVLCQLRLAFPDPNYKIMVYGLLPERNPATGRAGPNYHANGYAALMELNALSLGTWHPHDVLSPTGSRVSAGMQDPFNCCYLYNNENQSNVAMSLPELCELTASFLFQKIVQARPPYMNWGDQGSSIERQEGYELGAQANLPELSARNAPRRSRRFFSFGIKQITYPESEIREYLTYKFATQAARQLLYNFWVEGDGFQDAAANQNFAEYVRDPANLSRWYLSDERLTLSEGILPSEVNNAQWKPVGKFWPMLVPRLVTEVLDQLKNDWVKMLPEMTRLAELAFNEQYRSHGVSRFYETKRKDMTDHVRELRGRIERELFSDWRNGTRSMHDIDRLVQALLASMEERLQSIANRIASFSDDGALSKSNEVKITENRKQWSKLGPISVALGKDKSILNAQSETLITRYTMRTRLEGFRFAQDLLYRLTQELNALSADLARSKLVCSEAALRFSEATNSRLQDAEKDLSRPTVREYDSEQVRRFVKDLSTDLPTQRRQTGAVRERLVGLLGDRLTFASFGATVTVASFEDVVTNTCKEEAAAAHADSVSVNPERGRILDVSLVDFLRREYEGNSDAMNHYTRTVMNAANNFLKLSPIQHQLVGPGIPNANDPAQVICSTFVTIVAPTAQSSAEFRARFCNMLRDAIRIGTPRTVANDSRPHEITIISITNVFPLRFIEVVQYLKDQYKQRAQAQRAFLEIHSEGTQLTPGANEEIFDLYPETYTAADILPWLELAQALELIQEGQDHETGRTLLRLKMRNRIGLPEPPMTLGSTIGAVEQNAEPAIVEEIKAQVQALLRADYLRIEMRQQLAKAVFDKVHATADRIGPDAPRYKQELTAYKTTCDILELES
jgi:hypothetical protein